MNYDILITKASSGLDIFYDYKKDCCSKKDAIIGLLTSYRPFISFYQKMTGDTKGENIFLNYPNLREMYSYCCKAIHANDQIPNHIKVKKLKNDFKTLTIFALGKKTYKELKGSSKSRIYYY